MKSISIFNRVRVVLVLFLGLPFSLNANVECRPPGFKVFDATAYLSKPNLQAYGVETLPSVSQFWNKTQDRMSLPPAEGVKKAMRLGEYRGEKHVYVDVEHWPLTGKDSDVGESIRKYKKILDMVKEELPGVKVGLYSMVPTRDYWRAIEDESSPRKKEWKKENDRVKEIVGSADVLYPSLYTFYNNESEWERYAIENLREARRISEGKPVYAFLWPQYHYSNHLRSGKYIDEGFWRKQLEVVAKHSDGIVIWGGWDKTPEGYKKLRWYPRLGWWRETKEWLECSKTQDPTS